MAGAEVARKRKDVELERQRDAAMQAISRPFVIDELLDKNIPELMDPRRRRAEGDWEAGVDPVPVKVPVVESLEPIRDEFKSLMEKPARIDGVDKAQYQGAGVSVEVDLVVDFESLKARSK